MKIDEQILNIDTVICRHIDNMAGNPRGAISQDILAQLRNFLEHIMLKCMSKESDISNSYENIQSAIKYANSQGKLRVITQFHRNLQIVASHYTLDPENSERLMLKYYVYLLKIKKLLKKDFSLEVLENIEKFPINIDNNTQEYYNSISKKINNHNFSKIENSEKYYIQKIKPFFVDQHIYYEVTFSPANDKASKFNRVIAFTKHELCDNYAVQLSLKTDYIQIQGKTMPIIIITGWAVAIRDCEFKNFSKLIRGKEVKTGYNEQQGISNFLTTTGYNLSDLINFPEDKFQYVKREATKKSKESVFFNDLEQCRKIVDNNMPGSNLILYLLFHMNNRIIKKQYEKTSNNMLSNLYVKYGSIPFDKLPFNASLIGHNPKLRDLFSCIDSTERQHELLARLIKNNSEIKGEIFTPVKDLEEFDEIETLIKRYNQTLWVKHRESGSLTIKSGNLFINSYKDDSIEILEKLKELSTQVVKNYSSSVSSWLTENNHGVDCEEKKEILLNLFEHSNVSLIYGSAGTGKSHLINHLSHFFADKQKIYLAQTNPAVDNLKRKVNASNCKFSTISKFLSRQNTDVEFDLLIIDECSTVSNKAMKELLSKAKFKLLVLVGDTYQIESIRFGNWFSLARDFLPETSYFELTKPYRTGNSDLLKLWERVRKSDDTILELVTRQNYSQKLDESIFKSAKLDEIILCLNYDGLYGINNINRFLQENNPNKSVIWEVQQYKIGDPILFTDSERFSPVIYNNMKGKIIDIEIVNKNTPTECIRFDIELDKVINGMDARDQDFELLDSHNPGHSSIRFYVNKLKNVDDDDDSSLSVGIPFQVAYAVSIHKAQGLEYESVKIVITEEVDELITHSIFYTAITRARSELKIYWSPEVENKVLSNIKPRDNRRNIAILRSLI